MSNQITLNNCRTLRDEFSSDWREIAENMRDETDDFEVANYRFIHDSAIDQIQRDELESDEYILGCFNSWFLADVLELDTDVVEALQKAEAFEALGKMVIDMGKLEELQQAYARTDGYGHHFASYDGHGHEITNYHYFRIN